MCTCEPAAFTIHSDIAAALNFIHGSGLVHNDIKPANILYSQTRGAVLIDFGLARTAAEGMVHDGGTPWYMPPEFDFHKTRGPPGDIFAMGVTMLYVLRKCRLPEKEPGWMINQIHTDAPAVRSSAYRQMSVWIDSVQDLRARLRETGTLEWVVRCMLLDEPKDRYSSKQVVKELEAMMEL